MTILINSIIIFFIAVGVLFIIVTAIGLFRLPDLYTRAHAASKSATLGVMSVLTGVFLFVTSPVGGHILTRSSYIAGIKPWKGTKHDDLKEEIKRMRKEQNIQK